MNNSKTAIITGASSGIGLGMAQALLAKGYQVVANSRNITKSNSLPGSENVVLVDGDIADKAVAARVVDTAVRKLRPPRPVSEQCRYLRSEADSEELT